MAGQGAKDSFCWDKLSEELKIVLRRKGPVLIGDVSGAYKSVHGKNLVLYGHRLQDGISAGQLKGVRYNWHDGGMQLVASAGAGSIGTGVPTASRIAARKGPTVAAARRTSMTASTSSSARTTAASVNRSMTTTTSRKAGPETTSLGTSKTKAMKSGKTTNGSTSTTFTTASGQATSSLATKPTSTSRAPQPPAPPAPAPPATFEAWDDETTPSPLTPDNPPAYLPSNVMVDSVMSYEEFVGPSLTQICRGHAVAVQLEGRRLGAEGGNISIIKMAGSWPHPAALMFDVPALERAPDGHKLLRDQLLPMLEDETITKVVHDFTNSAIALRRHFGEAFTMEGALDTQFALEALQGDTHGTIGSVIKVFAGEHDLFSDAAYRATAFDHTADSSVPISSHELNRAARTVNSLAKAGESITKTGLTKGQRDQVLQASKLKVSFAICTLDDSRWMAFRDKGLCWGGGVGRVMTSYEMKKAQDIIDIGLRGKGVGTSVTSKTLQEPEATPLSFRSLFGSTKKTKTKATGEDVNSPLEVLQLVPEAFRAEHLSPSHKKNLRDLQEIVLDEGRRPKANLQGRGRLFLCSDKDVLVTANDIDKVVGRLEREKRFGDDNRAGFPGQLHRLSIMRRKQRGEIFAATLRIGRFFKGSAGLIDDILFHVIDVPGKPSRAASILVLGEAGSGKTTVIRDVCRKISAKQTVVIVDTSNEIAGDGNVPHREAIGESRRIMVPVKADQHKVMTEALQNHTPQTIVVDEISDKREAQACLDIKARGVRMVASAHGDLQSLLKNPNLNTLVGGTVSVTIGDKAADENGGNKVLTQRAGAPIFDMIIEIKRGEVGTWSIIKNVAVAVDALLDGGEYAVERRSRSERDSHVGSKDSNSEDTVFRLEHVREAEKAKLLY